MQIGISIVLAAGIPAYADRGYQPYTMLATNARNAPWLENSLKYYHHSFTSQIGLPLDDHRC